MTDVFQALGNEVRWQVLNILLAERKKNKSNSTGLCVCDIIKKCNVANSTMSHHLDWLRSAGLLTAEKKGKWIYYNVNMKTLVSLKKELAKLN